MMHTISGFLASDDDGTQHIFFGQPTLVRGRFFARCGGWLAPPCGAILPTSGHAINPGECRPVKLRVEAVDAR